MRRQTFVGLVAAVTAVWQPSLAADGLNGRATKLYREIKRLNATCVAAGGGVSGSPDCDAGTVKEDQLKKLGYCIDYPHNEALIQCAQMFGGRGGSFAFVH
jgi:hypothetical protein